MLRRRLLSTLALLLLTAGCGAPPLAHTYPTADALAAALLDAVAARDRPALDGMALDEAEFKAHVWPTLPASRPERNLPFSYVWGDLHQKSLLALRNTLASHGGKRYTLVSAAFKGVTDYGTYRVHRASSFTVRDEAGQTLTVQVCGSMVEKDGAWKVFSYVVD